MNQVSIGSDNGLSPIQCQALYLNQCWEIVYWTLRNKLQWNFNQNTKLFIHKNASENTVCKMVAILPTGRWVKEFSNHGFKTDCNTSNSIHCGAIITQSIFLQIPHKTHPIPHLLGPGMGCLLWVKLSFIFCFSHCSDVDGILPKGPYLPCVSMAGRALLAGYHRCMQFHIILDCIITALD